MSLLSLKKKKKYKIHEFTINSGHSGHNMLNKRIIKTNISINTHFSLQTFIENN